jgi:hypothetical protein
VDGLKKQHATMDSEAQASAAALAAAQAEVAELRTSLGTAIAQREDISKASDASATQVRAWN